MMYGVGMGLTGLLFLALVVIGVVWAVRASSDRREPPSPPAGGDPVRLLDERFARGEIDEEEYQRRRDVLNR